MKRTLRFPAAPTLLLAVFLLTFGCKSSNSDPAPLTSLQGSWKITGLTVDPAFMYLGVGITNLITALPLLGETCVENAVVTFNSNGSISNNIATQPTCTNATNTKLLINTFFGPTTTYAEPNATTATLTTGGQVVTGTKTFTTNTVTLVAKLPTDPQGMPVATTYTVVLTKQ